MASNVRLWDHHRCVYIVFGPSPFKSTPEAQLFILSMYSPFACLFSQLPTCYLKAKQQSPKNVEQGLEQTRTSCLQRRSIPSSVHGRNGRQTASGVCTIFSMVLAQKSQNIYQIATVTVPGPSSPSRDLPMKPTGSAFRRSIHVGAPFPRHAVH